MIESQNILNIKVAEMGQHLVLLANQIRVYKMSSFK